jgi:hypothetical protein
VDFQRNDSIEPKVLAQQIKRAGPRPVTRKGIPHLQLNQWPSPALIDKLTEQTLALPNVRERESRLADECTKAICLSSQTAASPANAFIDDHEFCHLHPAPEGSAHLTLPAHAREQIIRLGWAEGHPLAGIGFLPDSLVLVYAPRNEHELEMVLEIVKISYRFAQGPAAAGGFA